MARDRHENIMCDCHPEKGVKLAERRGDEITIARKKHGQVHTVTIKLNESKEDIVPTHVGVSQEDEQ